MTRWLSHLLTVIRPPARTRPSTDLGRRGEDIAARFLRKKGYRILMKNFRLETGEIDLIARHAKTLVFVEVKARSSDHIATPQRAVDLEKQRQVQRVASVYLSRYRTPRPDHRFDIIAIVWPPNGDPKIEHLENAFGG